MSKQLISLGLDVGTSTTQLILSRLTIENKASAFSVPEMEISRRSILYKSPIHFTPLLGIDRVDGNAIRDLVTQEYTAAGIDRQQVDTGAVIITGETSRKENARAVTMALSEFAGDFVVATAGPHLESILAAKGAGALALSEETGKTVLHMDIGGGTSNLALIRRGEILATGCLNIGGRLLKVDSQGTILYRSPVLQELFPYVAGQTPPMAAVKSLCSLMAQVLEMAAGLTEPTSLLHHFQTAEAGAVWQIPEKADLISFSGGVAECIDKVAPPFQYGDIGPILGQAIKRSRLCRGEHRLGSETIRATVIGAGCHAAQLSGSTVFYRNVDFPLKNLPVVPISAEEQLLPTLAQLIQRRIQVQEGPCVLAFSGDAVLPYPRICALAEILSTLSGPIYLAFEQDMAKALGQALALRLPPERTVLCIDRVRLPKNSYLDVGKPIGSALPVIIKTLIWEK